MEIIYVLQNVFVLACTFMLGYCVGNSVAQSMCHKDLSLFFFQADASMFFTFLSFNCPTSEYLLTS